MTLSEITEAARALAEAARANIEKADDRDEHLRITILAMEADRLASELEAWKGEL